MLELLVLALATSAISVTITRGSVFAKLRSWLIVKSQRLGKLVSCPYCLSHWLAILLVAVYRPTLVEAWFIIDLAVSAFVVVAIAAIISGLITRLLDFSDEREKLIADLVSTLEQTEKYIKEVINNGKTK